MVPLVIRALLDSTDATPTSFFIQIGAADLPALRYNGDKLAWRDKCHMLETYLEDKHALAAAIFTGEVTQVMAMQTGHEGKFLLANRALASFLLRVIDHKEGSNGEALVKQILSKVRDHTLPDKCGDELKAYLDSRAEFVSEADQREALIALKALRMTSSMTREQVEAFGITLRDLYDRCGHTDKGEMGSLIVTLAGKMPSDLKAEAKQLRTQLAMQSTFNCVAPDYDAMLLLISDIIVNARLDSRESGPAAHTASKLSTPGGAADPRDSEIKRLTALLAAGQGAAALAAGGVRRVGPPPPGKDKMCLNCGSKDHEHPECTLASCSCCGKRWCGALRGLPCCVCSRTVLHDTREDVYGRPPSENFKAMCERARSKQQKASANVAVTPAPADDDLAQHYGELQLGPGRGGGSSISFNFVTSAPRDRETKPPIGGIDMSRFTIENGDSEKDFTDPMDGGAAGNLLILGGCTAGNSDKSAPLESAPLDGTTTAADVAPANGMPACVLQASTPAHTRPASESSTASFVLPSLETSREGGSLQQKVTPSPLEMVSNARVAEFNLPAASLTEVLWQSLSFGASVVSLSPAPQVMLVNGNHTIPILLDSGASDSVFRSPELLRGAKQAASVHDSIGVGNAAHPILVNGEARPVLLLCGAEEVVPLAVFGLVAPTFARDIISTGQLFDVCGVRCAMDDVMELVTPEGKTVPIRREDSRLFVVDVLIPSDEQAHALVARAVHADEMILLWHARMCHSARSAARFIAGTEGHGLTHVSPRGLQTINECSVRKGAQQKASPTHSTAVLSKAAAPGHRLVFDGWGPYGTPCVATGHTYVMVSGDEFTSLPLAGSTLHHRAADWLSFLDGNIAYYMTWGHQVLSVRADGAGEFQAEEWSAGLAARKVSREMSAAHEKDGIGLAECIVRLGQEKMRAFMGRSSLNKGFVILAYLYAIHVLQFFVRRGDSCCRLAAVTGSHKEQLKRLKIFGCVMDGRISPECRSDKGSKVTRRGLFVGIKQGHFMLFAAGKMWLVQNDATFYEGGMLRVGLAPKQLLVDSSMQTTSGDESAGSPQRSTVQDEPELALDPDDVDGPRPDGGQFNLRSRARAAFALALYDIECQEQIAEMGSAAGASRAFASYAHTSSPADAAATTATLGLPGMKVQPEAQSYASAISGGRMVQLLGPQGAYEMFQPKGYGNSERCADAPAWRTAREVHLASICKLGRITIVPRRAAAGETVYKGHWVFDIKVHKDSGWLDKLKARYVVNCSEWELEWDCFSGASPDEFVMIVIGYAAVARRITFKYDVCDAYQTQAWPDGKPRFAEMPPGSVEYDADGTPMVMQFNAAFWGFPPSGNILDCKMVSTWTGMGAKEICSAPRVYTLRSEGECAHAITHVDDGFVSVVKMETAHYIISKLESGFGGKGSIKVSFSPEAYKAMSLAWGPGVVTLRLTGMVVDIAQRRAPQLLTAKKVSAMPGEAEKMIAELREFVRPSPLPMLTKEQKVAQQWIGELKFCDSIVIHLKYVVHELTRHMSFPPVPVITELLTLCTWLALSAAEDGLTYGGSSVHALLPLECHTTCLNPSLDPSPLEQGDLASLLEHDSAGAVSAAQSRGLTPAAMVWAKINCPEVLPARAAPDFNMQGAGAELEGQSDATWQTPPTKSVACVVITMFGAAISVSSTCIPAVMHASFNAELYAAVMLAHKISWIRMGATELGLVQKFPTAIWGDHSAVVALSKPGNLPSKSKTDARRVGVMQDYVRNGELTVGKIDTKLNASDYLGKLLDVSKFKRTLAFLTNSSNAVAPKLGLASLIKVAVEQLKSGS